MWGSWDSRSVWKGRELINKRADEASWRIQLLLLPGKESWSMSGGGIG